MFLSSQGNYCGIVRKEQQTCAEGKEEGPYAAEWYDKVDSEEVSWNDGVEEEEEVSTLCIPKIWLN